MKEAKPVEANGGGWNDKDARGLRRGHDDGSEDGSCLRRRLRTALTKMIGEKGWLSPNRQRPCCVR